MKLVVEPWSTLCGVAGEREPLSDEGFTDQIWIVAEQSAAVPPLAPAQLQIQGWPLPVTSDAVPAEQRLAEASQPSGNEQQKELLHELLLFRGHARGECRYFIELPAGNVYQYMKAPYARYGARTRTNRLRCDRHCPQLFMREHYGL